MRSPTRRRAISPFLLVVGLGIGAALAIAFYGRHETFLFDEWQIVLFRRLDGIDAFVTQYNGHLPALPVLIYRSILAFVGLQPYGVYRGVGIAVHIACAVALFVYARRRVAPSIAVLAAALLLFLGRGWEVLLWPMNAFFFALPLLALIVAFLLLDRGDLKGDVGAGLAVAAALASSGVGIPVAAGVAVELAWRRWRRLWVVAVPLVLWGLWAITLKRPDPLVGDASAIPGVVPGDVVSSAGHLPSLSTLVTHFPSYVGHEAAAAFGGVFGARPAFGVAIGMTAVLLLGRKLFTDREVSPRLLATITVGVLFWSFTALTRSQVADPQSSRYTYVGSVILLLAGVEAGRGVRIARPAMAILAAGSGVAVVLGLQQLSLEGRVLRNESAIIRTELTAIEAQRTSIDPSFRPDPQIGGVTAGAYLAAVDSLGSPFTNREP